MSGMRGLGFSCGRSGCPRRSPSPKLSKTAEHVAPKTLREVDKVKVNRIPTGITEFDRVLGGGIVPGSLILLGGAPGIGKSTITLDVSMKAANRGIPVLYVSGEESEAQTAMRAERLARRPMP